MDALTAPEELKQSLEALGSILEKSQGCFLFRRGEDVSGVFLISRGVIRLGLERDPRGFPARRLGPGSVVGLPATLSNLPYSLTAEVLEDSQLVFVPAERLRALLREKPQLCFDVMNILSEELTQTRTALERVRKTAC
jgi:CRP/FNR family transcriptional regulator, polysaccharide utilization system transcription regulator